MAKEFTPTCSQEEFEHLHEGVEKAQYPVQYAKVKADALRHLLLDHAKLHAQLKTEL